MAGCTIREKEEKAMTHSIFTSTSITRKSWWFFTCVAASVAALGGTALAGHQASGVKSYTGCLTPGEGPIIKIKEGNVPSSPCTGNQVQAHFSGGDDGDQITLPVITAVEVGLLTTP